MSQDSDVIVIGAGVIGVCSAYYLQKEGRRVTILEQGKVCSGSSYGNAGWLVASHAVPLAQPGAVMRGLRWMFNPRSPFYIKPRLDRDLIAWLWRFRGAANERAVLKAVPVISELGFASLDLYAELVSEEALDCRYQQRGLMLAYKTEREYEEGVEEARLLVDHGFEPQELEGPRALEMEPALRPEVAGAVYYPGDASLKPDELVNGLAARFVENGGVIETDTEVQGFEMSGGAIRSVKTSRGVYPAQHVVLAAGAWSPGVVRDLGLRLPVQPAKGYSITYDDPVDPPSMPVMLSEARVGVTPMGPLLRFAGTLELSGLNTDIDPRRVDAIRGAARDYLVTDLSGSQGEVWCGMRPLSPDNLPIIGTPRQASNLIVATGHSMTGVSLAAVTGKMVSQIATGQPTIVDARPFSPERFG